MLRRFDSATDAGYLAARDRFVDFSRKNHELASNLSKSALDGISILVLRMKMNIRTFALVFRVGAVGAAGAASSVTVQPSSIGFKQALAACPPGTWAQSR